MKILLYNFSLLFLILLCYDTYGQVQPSIITYLEYSYDGGHRTQRRVVVINDNIDQNAKIIDSIPQDSSNIIQSSKGIPLFSENFGEIEVSIFPNPTIGSVTLKTNRQDKIMGSKVFIYSETGELLAEEKDLDTEQVFDFSKYSDGNYFLKISINNIDQTYKIIKTK